MNKHYRAYTLGAVLIGLAAILWGLDGVVLTPRLFNLNTAFVVLLLHLIPFVLMNLFLYREIAHIKKFSREDIVYFSLIALFGGAIGTLAIVKALFLVNFQQLSIVVLLQKLQPVFAILLASLLLKEKLGKQFLFWAALALVAGYCMTFGFSAPNLTAGTNTLQAALYSLLAAFSFGSATVFGKKVLQKYEYQTVTYFRFGLTSIIMLAYVALIGVFLEFAKVTAQNWMIFIIIAFTTGSGAIFIYYYGLQRVPAIVSTICELLFPISAVFFDYLFNHKVLSITQIISALVMILAVIMITQNKAVEQKSKIPRATKEHNR